MNIKITSNIDAARILRERGMGTSDAARIVLANEVARLSDPYVPMQQGALKNTVQVAADGSEIVYNQPYAHYQYHGKVFRDDKGRAYYGKAPKHETDEDIQYHGAPLRGKEWEKRMMIDHGDEVAEAVAKKVGGKLK